MHYVFIIVMLKIIKYIHLFYNFINYLNEKKNIITRKIKSKQYLNTSFSLAQKLQ